jgi:glycosyltransferase involved in cell wall biosynthesis
VKLAVVVQRYGQFINGGAELHARYIAEHLSRHVEVEVLTTCATDYVTWRNERPAGVESINGVTVRRFPVVRERDPIVFGQQSSRVFREVHSIGDELRWLDEEGPVSPALLDHLASQGKAFDYCIFFSYRYHHAFHGVRTVPQRAVLVPTAERDSTIGLEIFGAIFRGVRALMYNSPEEQAMIQAVSGNSDIPSVVVGVGSDVPAAPQPARFRQTYNIREPFAIYVGRIDENKGCRELFAFFAAYLRERVGKLSLVLVGNSLLQVPDEARIRHLGFLEDRDKFDAMAAADVLIMPSYYESLSMVALEAWALGRPVLANAKCDVLHGQCVRSNGGLFYDGVSEFVEALRFIESNRWLAENLGRNGRRFFREQYDWPVIERKYLEMLDHLSATPSRRIEKLPGWWTRGRRNCRPADEILAGLPSGPSIEVDRHAARSPGSVATSRPDARDHARPGRVVPHGSGSARRRSPASSPGLR